jgi:hypothetical protein
MNQRGIRNLVRCVRLHEPLYGSMWGTFHTFRTYVQTAYKCLSIFHLHSSLCAWDK